MKDIRSIERIRMLLLLAFAIALALGSFWVVEALRKGLSDSLPNIPRNEPDYFVEKFKFVRMTATGQVHYAISGTRMTHNPQDFSYEIQQPTLKSINENQPPITIRADRAVAEQDNSKVHLYDNVQMDRPASGPTEHFHLASEYLLALPDDDVMQTDKPVEITLGTSILTGTGMYINHATREFRLANNVRGVYQPPPPN